MKHYIFDIIVLIIMFLFVNSIQTYFHESIHAEICESFGGAAEIKYSFFMQGGETTCTTKEGSAYHIINDIVSYTASILVITAFMGLVFIAIVFEKKRILSK
ncbi:hypothetical protein L6303_06995 [archaeon]|nr:hypothetical protein [Nanoarchaeota archaeon]MBU4300832.1 hypothetical protein [Nanoarchaeota archaeon]MBU4452023.1 hypothetical protein [Nanoarchaeota archaeon]MCG2724464.1 hypothetical protein [archaeon]